MHPKPMMRMIIPPCVVLSALLTGCESGKRKELPPEPPPPQRTEAAGEVARGTVGAETLLVNVDPQALRGFGLVIGLDGRGSSDCPTVIRDYLIDFMTKQVGPQSGDDKRIKAPGQLIDSEDTAIVQVVGYVPAGSRRGTRIDLYVTALRGTATESLKGGMLLPTELRFFDQSASGRGLIAGAVLGEAGGPIFVNPVPPPEASEDAIDPRRGVILGGGRCTQSRDVRLRLMRPAYQTARRIERRINERFGQNPPVADAESRGYVTLRTPPKYSRQPQRFRDVAVFVTLDNNPAARERKWRELASLVAAGGAPLEAIARCWEAGGRSVIPYINSFYDDRDANLRYYAARAGVRLADPVAVPALADIAANADHPQQLAAIEELGNSDSPQAAVRLIPLLDDPQTRVRIAAYEALLRRSHPGIRSVPFRDIIDRTQLNFILDVVDCEGPPLVYVRQTRLPRIAVFGRAVPVLPPVFYSDPGDAVTLVTAEGSDELRLYAKAHGWMSEEIRVPPSVDELIEAMASLPLHDAANQLEGIGLSYSHVVRVLARLCRDEVIPAPLVLERIGPIDWGEPAEMPERPEADETDSELDDWSVPMPEEMDEPVIDLREEGS